MAGGDLPSSGGGAAPAGRKSPFAPLAKLLARGGGHGNGTSHEPDAKAALAGRGSWGGGGPSSSEAGAGGEGEGDMIWNEDIAGALGYGKGGRPGAAYQWWIPVLAGLMCLGSFIAWAVLVVRGRDATARAMQTIGVAFPWWRDARGLIAATAVMYPIFVAAALAVSAWRARLARTLDIHAPESAWLKRSRAWQTAHAVTHALLWFMVLLLVLSLAGHAVWGYMAQMMDLVSGRAIALVGPVWGSVAQLAQSATSLTDRVTGLLGSLPAVSGRRLLDDAGAAATVGALLEAARAQQAHARALQQSPLLDGLGQIAKGIATGLNAAANAIPAAIPNMPSNVTIPGLPALLPNGTQNPLVGAVTEVTRALETQVLNPTGCPVYCIDLRNERWWVDPKAGCFCNLDRLQSAIPDLRTAWRSVLPACLALMFMYIGASALLLHGAAQWARTRNEAKLMTRIPAGAAAAAAAAAAAEAEAAEAAKLAPRGGKAAAEVPHV